jgi:hypothetical protein
LIFNNAIDAVADLKKDDVPIFVPVFNSTTYTLSIIAELEKINAKNIIICDNGSTYKPMVELLNKLSEKYKVVLWGKNLGPRVYSEAIDLIDKMPDHYIVTDPDLLFNNKMPEDYIKSMIRISEDYEVSKVGLALEIFDEEEQKRFFDSELVKSWEFGYWSNKIDNIFYKLYVAPVDTTFALINKKFLLRDLKKYYGYSSCVFPAIRIGGKFTAKHMGWWKEQPWTEEEESHYNSKQIWASTYKEKVKNGYYDDREKNV